MTEDQIILAVIIMVLILALFILWRYKSHFVSVTPIEVTSIPQNDALNNLNKRIIELMVIFKSYPGYDTEKIERLQYISDIIDTMPHTEGNYIALYNAVSTFDPYTYLNGTLPDDRRILTQLILIKQAINYLGYSLNLT